MELSLMRITWKRNLFLTNLLYNILLYNICDILFK